MNDENKKYEQKEEQSTIKRGEGKIEGKVQIEINRRKENTGEQKRKSCEHEGKRGTESRGKREQKSILRNV
jgi:hypothetical protein